VQTGQSVGFAKQACSDVPVIKDPKPGMSVPSRCYPITGYQVCRQPKAPAKATPWGFCLDSPCKVDADGNKWLPKGCDPTISSATVKDSQQITDFLKQPNSTLQPLPIVVVHPR
jgi:hypothetical protein